MTFRRADTGPMGPSHLGRHAAGGIRTRAARECRNGFARGVALLVALSSCLTGLLVPPLAGQSTANDMRLRIGVTAGGIGSIGASVEFLWGSRSVDVNLATLSFSEVSLAVTGKQYFGGGDLRPFLGVGLWGIAGSTGQEGEQTGKVLILRVPVGSDWNFTGSHHLGGSLAVNEGLWIDRADPEDDTPVSRRPVPVPGFFYRFER